MAQLLVQPWAQPGDMIPGCVRRGIERGSRKVTTSVCSTAEPSLGFCVLPWAPHWRQEAATLESHRQNSRAASESLKALPPLA